MGGCPSGTPTLRANKSLSLSLTHIEKRRFIIIPDIDGDGKHLNRCCYVYK